MAHKRPDVKLSRLRKWPIRLPTGWMSLKRWWWQHCKEMKCNFVLDRLFGFHSNSSSVFRKRGAAILTESKIVHPLLYCSNRRHSHRAVYHKCRTINRTQCTWALAAALSIRPTMHNTRRYNIPGCRCRLYRNTVLPGQLYSTNATVSVQFPMIYYAWPCQFSQWNSSLAEYLRKWSRWCHHVDSPTCAGYGGSNRLCALHSNHEHLQSYP